MKKNEDSIIKIYEEDLLNISMRIFDLGIDKIVIEDKHTLNTVIASLSYYYDLNHDERSLSILKQICESTKVDLDIRLFLYWQLVRIDFINTNKRSDTKLRDTYEVISIDFNNKSKFKKVDSTKQRNENIAVLITNQFLGYEHAPTKVLMNIAKTINDKYKEIDQIYIFNSTEMPTDYYCNFYKPFIANYINPYKEILNININIAGIDRCEVCYYQNQEESSTLTRIEPMLEKIWSLNPSFIISVGGQSILADLCNNFIDVYTYGTVRGVPIAKTKYLVNLANNKEITEELVNENQYFIGIPQGLYGLKNKYDESYTRADFGIPEKMFLISVVGVRLDLEVTIDFINMCKNILTSNKNAGIILIGGYNKDAIKNKIPKDIYERIYSVGFKINLLSAISLSDLFLNPIRTGGGYGGIYAMMCNIPIISIDKGDVAAILTEKFKVKDYNEMYEITNNIINNCNLYYEMCNKMKKIHEEYKNNDWDLLIDYILKKNKKR